MATYGGWVGKTLRVNLTTGKISQEDTIAKYKDYIGGAGIGLKVMWDEVPTVKATDPENKIVFAGGPLTGTSAPSSARMTITSRSNIVYEKDRPDLHLVTTSHMGGHWAPALKHAGWDALIVEGKANAPCYIAIIDDKVEIRDASKMWGQGTYKASTDMMQEVGSDSAPLAIGQAGENMIPCSVIINSQFTSASGHAAVLGSKNLKGVCVKGTGSVRIAADKSKWKDLINYILPLLAQHNATQPYKKQSWSEYAPGFNHWNGGPGYFWGAANPKMYSGETEPHNIHKMGYRVNQYIQPYCYRDGSSVVRHEACFGCPIACYVRTSSEEAARWGVPKQKVNTCSQGFLGWMWCRTQGPTDAERLELNTVGSFLMDDYGIWDHYTSLPKIFKYAFDKGIIKQKLSEAEYNSIPWDQFEKGGPAFVQDLLRRIAFKDGELGTALGLGSAKCADRWGFYDELSKNDALYVWSHGAALHHAHDNPGQIGVLMQLPFNRDAMSHDQSHLTQCHGLPLAVAQGVVKKLFGDVLDPNDQISPINEDKAKFAAWAVNEKLLQDSLTVCGRPFAVKFSPLKERGYVGDLTIESQLYSAVTGDTKNFDELQFAGNRIVTLLRAITMRDMNTKDMSNKHDTIPEYVYADQRGKVPFQKGHYYLDRADLQSGKEMFYEKMGWDKTTGAPTRARLEQLGMKSVADDLAVKGLLP